MTFPGYQPKTLKAYLKWELPFLRRKYLCCIDGEWM